MFHVMPHTLVFVRGLHSVMQMYAKLNKLEATVKGNIDFFFLNFHFLENVLNSK